MKYGEIWRIIDIRNFSTKTVEDEFVFINKVSDDCVWCSWLSMNYSTTIETFHFMMSQKGFVMDFYKVADSLADFIMDKQLLRNK